MLSLPLSHTHTHARTIVHHMEWVYEIGLFASVRVMKVVISLARANTGLFIFA